MTSVYGVKAVPLMLNDITDFREDYVSRLTAEIERFLRSDANRFVDQISPQLFAQRNTIYIFGNGGSHAIGRCIEYSLRELCLQRRIPKRFSNGVDVHDAAFDSVRPVNGVAFVNALINEGANDHDLIILISGSGSSENLCEVAKFAREKQIPIVGLIGSSDGALNGYLEDQERFCVGMSDQQLSEDVIQSLSIVLSAVVSGTFETTQLATLCQRVRDRILSIDIHFLCSLVKAIWEASNNCWPVHVVGVDHPVMSVCAEHIAHNIFWDGIYEVPNPPHRWIGSSLTACDLTGISNDRKRALMRNYYALGELPPGSVVVIFPSNGSCSYSDDAFTETTSLGSRVFVVEDTWSRQRRNDEATPPSPFENAVVAQAVGHMCGRMLRFLFLRQRSPQRQAIDFSDAEFLKSRDLAQRRLIDALS